MNIDISGPLEPLGGFESPLENLAACHRRAGLHCAMLGKLVDHLGTNGIDAVARTDAASVLHYFDTSLKIHHADEEADLFPALLESMAGSDAVCIHDLIAALTIDHRGLESNWQRLRVGLNGISAGAASSLTAADVESFITLHERHIAREGRELLPMAHRLLTDEALAQVGQAMRLRRGIAAPG